MHQLAEQVWPGERTSVGHSLAYQAVLDVDLVLHVFQLRPSKDVKLSLIRFGVLRRYDLWDCADGNIYLDDALAAGQRTIIIDDNYEAYKANHAGTTKMFQGQSFPDPIPPDGVLAAAAVIDNAIDVRTGARPLGRAKYVTELNRLKKSNRPRSENSLNALKQASEPKVAANKAQKFAVGAYVQKTGLRGFRPYQWLGRIVARSGGSWEVRVTWVNGNSPLVVGKSYKLIPDEMRPRTRTVRFANDMAAVCVADAGDSDCCRLRRHQSQPASSR